MRMQAWLGVVKRRGRHLRVAEFAAGSGRRLGEGGVSPEPPPETPFLFLNFFIFKYLCSLKEGLPLGSRIQPSLNRLARKTGLVPERTPTPVEPSLSPDSFSAILFKCGYWSEVLHAHDSLSGPGRTPLLRLLSFMVRSPDS